MIEKLAFSHRRENAFSFCSRLPLCSVGSGRSFAGRPPVHLPQWSVEPKVSGVELNVLT